jgi:hypothetical protein
MARERAVSELQVVKVTIFAARGRAVTLTALTFHDDEKKQEERAVEAC